MEERIEYLESLIPKDREDEIEKKYRSRFTKGAQYMGNGVYSWMGIVSTNVRELYLMGVLRSENIKFKEE